MTDETSWFDEKEATFGDRLAGARENVGLSQAKLAKSIGVKTSTLAAWENDLSEPRANRLSMLSGNLGVSLGWLLTGEGEGLDAPEDSLATPAELSAILAEMRGLRTQMLQSAEKMGRLEKRLKQVMR